jgi:hypothetical protein
VRRRDEQGARAKGVRCSRDEEQGSCMPSDEVGDSSLPPPRFIAPRGAALPKPHVPCTLTAGVAVRSRQLGPTTPKRPGTRARAFIMAR